MFFGPKKGKTLSIAVKKFILSVKIFILKVSKSRELLKIAGPEPFVFFKMLK